MSLERVTLELRSKASVGGKEPLLHLHIMFGKFSDMGHCYVYKI